MVQLTHQNCALFFILLALLTRRYKFIHVGINGSAELPKLAVAG